ncbi:MAG: hypothetical protein LUE27_06530 [Clostridia bacterium]|nr:hypothetical protein [Clostridia bacterium]
MNFGTVLDNPQEICSVQDIQTVMNTIHSVFRYACREDGMDYDSPEVVNWLVIAFSHLADLTEAKKQG